MRAIKGVENQDCLYPVRDGTCLPGAGRLGRLPDHGAGWNTPYRLCLCHGPRQVVRPCMSNSCRSGPWKPSWTITSTPSRISAASRRNPLRLHEACGDQTAQRTTCLQHRVLPVRQPLWVPPSTLPTVRTLGKGQGGNCPIHYLRALLEGLLVTSIRQIRMCSHGSLRRPTEDCTVPSGRRYPNGGRRRNPCLRRFSRFPTTLR